MLQSLGELVRPIADAMTVNGGSIRNPIGLAVDAVRRGVAPMTPEGMVFALCCAWRAARRGHDPVGLFWFLARRPDRLYAGDSEWVAVRAWLESAGRSIDDLLRIARSGVMRDGVERPA